MNKQFTKLLILFAMTTLLLTACGNVHIPEVTPVDRQARMEEAKTLIMPNGYVVGETDSGQQLYTRRMQELSREEGTQREFW